MITAFFKKYQVTQPLLIYSWKNSFEPHCPEKSVSTCKIQVMNLLCYFLEEETLCLMTNSSEAKQGRAGLTKTIKAADIADNC